MRVSIAVVRDPVLAVSTVAIVVAHHSFVALVYELSLPLLLGLVDISGSNSFDSILLDLSHNLHLGVGLFGQVFGAFIHRWRLHHLDLVLTQLVHLAKWVVEYHTRRGQEVRLVVFAVVHVLHHIYLLLMVEDLQIVDLLFA